MYDDRLEIESPGKFPNIVNIDNIKTINFSINHHIVCVLANFSIVKKLNEEVKYIYSDIEKYFLEITE